MKDIKKDIEEKIEEILKKYTNNFVGFLDGEERVTFYEKFFIPTHLINDISTLIQSERKKAVEGFVDWELKENETKGGIVMLFRQDVKQYLKESESK